jgi:hypothetical protein
MSGSAGRGYSFRISAEGMREFTADIQRVSAESAGAQQAFARLIQASPQLASAMMTAEEATRRAADRARDLREANERAAAAAASLPGQLDRAAQGFDQMAGRTLAARRAVADFRGALELVGADAVGKTLGPLASEIGNVADAFSTAGLAARAGAGALGLVVPVLGAVAGAAGLLYAAYQTLTAQAESYGTEQERLNAITGFAAEAQTAYQRAIEATDNILETAEERAIALANARRDQAFETLRAAEAANALAQAEAERIQSNLAGSLATVGEDAGAYAAMGYGGQSAADVARRTEFLRQQQRLVEERTAALRAEADELARRRTALGSEQGRVLYGSPIGPSLPSAGTGGGRAAGGADSITRMVQRAVEQDARAQERAREQIARDEARVLAERERAHQQTTDRITRYLADGFADVFRDTGRGFKGLLRAMQDAAISTPIRLVADAVLRPIVSAGVSAVGGANGELGRLLGLSDLGSQISGALGLGGMGSGLSRLLNTTVISASGPIGPTISGAAMGGGASLGQLLGGAGAGFGAGMMLNSALGGNQTGGMIGSGVGAAVGALASSVLFPGIGPVLGGLIGGAGGGSLGGLFGGRRGSTFYNAVIGSSGGRLSLDSVTGKNAGQQMAALQQQAAQQIQAINAQLDALGLTVSGRADVGQGVGGLQQFGSLAAAGSRFRLQAQDLRIQAAIDRAGGTLDALGAAQEAGAFAQQLDALRRAADDAADPIEAIRRQFDTMRETAQRLGFGLDEVNAAQERAIRQAEDQRRQAASRTATGLVDGIADYARRLRTANDNSGNPLSRLSAADRQFSATVSAALSGDTAALGRLTADAETFRGLSRDVFGSGQGFADAEARIVGALERVGLVGADQLTASILAAETRTQTETLVAALGRLQAEVTALRQDARQAAANPLALRA